MIEAMPNSFSAMSNAYKSNYEILKPTAHYSCQYNQQQKVTY